MRIQNPTGQKRVYRYTPIGGIATNLSYDYCLLFIYMLTKDKTIISYYSLYSK